MSKNYKELKLNLSDDLDVHHIDWDDKNDNIDNLIVIPKKIHELVHEYLGYVTIDELTTLVNEFESTPNYRKRKTSFLNYKLSKFVDTEKNCELSISCREKIGPLKQPRIKKINYRKLYESEQGKINEGWEIHHIDWNHENNVIDNLIAIPKKIHILVHKYLGYVNRKELEKVLEVYKESNFPPTSSVGYLNYHLCKYVDTKKTDNLSVQCRVGMESNIVRYQNAFDWRDGKGGMF
jgi:hypothetical protein